MTEDLDFKLLFENAPGLFLVTLPTPDFKIVGASDALLKATMTEREKIVGRGLFEAFPDNPGDLHATGVTNVRASLERVLASKAPDTMAVQRYDIRRPENEGGGFEERFWSTVNAPVLSADGRIAYIIHRAEDVTELVRMRRMKEAHQEKSESLELEVFSHSQDLDAANKKLREANGQIGHRTLELQRLNKELEAFSYSVAHDLGAPLRSISGFSQILLEDHSARMDPQAKEYLLRIRAAGQKMKQLINDLLYLSRVTRQEIKAQEVDLSALAKAVIEDLRRADPGRQVAFEAPERATVKGDSGLLGIAMENLISNAWKFTGKRKEARIEFSLARKDGEIVYFVKDNGVGFDMADADKLFKPFQRLHPEEEFSGTGIGLATVQRVVARHHGRVWAEGAVGQGCAIYFTLGSGNSR